MPFAATAGDPSAGALGTGSEDKARLKIRGARLEMLTLGLTYTPTAYERSPAKVTWMLLPALVATAVAGLGFGYVLYQQGGL